MMIRNSTESSQRTKNKTWNREEDILQNRENNKDQTGRQGTKRRTKTERKKKRRERDGEPGERAMKQKGRYLKQKIKAKNREGGIFLESEKRKPFHYLPWIQI